MAVSAKLHTPAHSRSHEVLNACCDAGRKACACALLTGHRYLDTCLAVAPLANRPVLPYCTFSDQEDVWGHCEERALGPTNDK